MLPLLAATAIEPTPEGIRIGAAILDASTARALWLRLGEALGEVERSDEASSWLALRHRLDREFRAATPIRCREIGTRQEITGLLAVGETKAMLRLDTFVIVPLVKGDRHWTGQMCACHPIDTVGAFRLVSTYRRIATRREFIDAARVRMFGPTVAGVALVEGVAE